MVKICATSDLHGNLPEIPECDILVIGGDLCVNAHTVLQMKWMEVALREWLDTIPAKEVVAISGNHDLIFERAPHLLPTGLRWHYLQDDLIELCGLKIYGTPWITPIWGAYQGSEETLARKFNQIPEDVDIVVCHSPPYGIGDEAPRKTYTAENEHLWPTEHCGSVPLRDRLFKIKPQAVFFGHVHEGYGVYEHEGIMFFNCSLMNASFSPNNAPFVFDVNPK